MKTVFFNTVLKWICINLWFLWLITLRIRFTKICTSSVSSNWSIFFGFYFLFFDCAVGIIVKEICCWKIWENWFDCCEIICEICEIDKKNLDLVFKFFNLIFIDFIIVIISFSMRFLDGVILFITTFDWLISAKSIKDFCWIWFLIFDIIKYWKIKYRKIYIKRSI